MLLLIDHYDSFSSILLDYFRQLNINCCRVYTDKIDIKQISEMNLTHLVFGPGPGHPQDSELSLAKQLFYHYKGTLPILGVCLGFQLIANIFGGEIIQSEKIYHGDVSNINIDNRSQLFKNFPNQINVTRYHSLEVVTKTLPEEFSEIATMGTKLMAFENKQQLLYGLQFHPEAYLTEYGLLILKSFIQTLPI